MLLSYCEVDGLEKSWIKVLEYEMGILPRYEGVKMEGLLRVIMANTLPGTPNEIKLTIHILAVPGVKSS